MVRFRVLGLLCRVYLGSLGSRLCDLRDGVGSFLRAPSTSGSVRTKGVPGFIDLLLAPITQGSVCCKLLLQWPSGIEFSGFGVREFGFRFRI